MYITVNDKYAKVGFALLQHASRDCYVIENAIALATIVERVVGAAGQIHADAPRVDR